MLLELHPCTLLLQDLSMALHAWAVLTAGGLPADASGKEAPELDALARALFSSVALTVSHPGALLPEQLGQLFQAHQVGFGAAEGGVPCCLSSIGMDSHVLSPSHDRQSGLAAWLAGN